MPSEPTVTTPVRNPALDQQLIDAAWANDVAFAQQLIADGADVNAKDDTVQSAYLIATSEGYLDLLELALANGADLTSLDSYNGTGLIRAAERGHADIVGRLLLAGIEVDHVNRPQWTALDEAIVYGDGATGYIDTVRALVAGGADLTRVAGDGQTPLQHAEDRGFDTIATTLAAGRRLSGLPGDRRNPAGCGCRPDHRRLRRGHPTAACAEQRLRHHRCPVAGCRRLSVPSAPG